MCIITFDIKNVGTFRRLIDEREICVRPKHRKTVSDEAKTSYKAKVPAYPNPAVGPWIGVASR